jgi:cation diffusion facilitator CzcD-associated flavoprotein CzcO
MGMHTDYLVVGARASGLAFADTLLAEANVAVTLVDGREGPGGHWQQAYPFVCTRRSRSTVSTHWPSATIESIRRARTRGSTNGDGTECP